MKRNNPLHDATDSVIILVIIAALTPCWLCVCYCLTFKFTILNFLPTSNKMKITNFKTTVDAMAGGCEDSYGDVEYYDTITGSITIDGMDHELRRHWSDDSNYLHVIDSHNTIIGRIEFDGTGFKLNDSK